MDEIDFGKTRNDNDNYNRTYNLLIHQVYIAGEKEVLEEKWSWN
ncbi:hypothetical protein [Paenibacillus glacialis]|nr:hypothetical protein [Paenibacillus glacialis]